ncbi:MAG: Xaa-Pro peptidase family protein [Roseococcus sp.]
MPHPIFDQAEFDTRIARLRTAMARAGVAAALFDEIEAMAWLGGYGSSLNRWRCLVVPLDGAPFILIRALDASVCRAQSWVPEVLEYQDWADPMPVLAGALAARGLAAARIGLDRNSYAMSLARFDAMQAALPRAGFTDLGPIVHELRLIKSPAEIALLRRSSGVADTAIAEGAAALHPGGTQRDAAMAVTACFLRMGADPSLPGPISTVTGWDFLHAPLDTNTLARGDMVHIELTPRIAGYSARIMRCVSLGPPSDAAQRATDALIALQDAQIAAMRPGALARDVDAILREGVVRAGLRDSYDNITAYTLGLYAPQTPRTSDFTRIFTPVADWPLEAGMVFHVYASAGGTAISETVLVGAHGPERLTRAPRGLIVND